MSHPFYKPVVEKLHSAGYELLRNGRGSHVVFKNAAGKEICITRNLNDRNLANKVLRIAGIKDARFG